MIKATVVGCVIALAIAIVIASIGSGCFVDRPSDKLKCSDQSQCQDGRVCEAGYCVFDYAQCPRQCTSCDVTANPPLCTIEINGSPGDSLICPSNMQCEITCHNPGSCGAITCAGGASCDVTCLAHNSCRNVTCGTGPCNVTCSGTNACGAVTCANSCACDVTCAQGDCGTLSCPKDGSAAFCTASGSNNQPCISAISGCSHC